MASVLTDGVPPLTLDAIGSVGLGRGADSISSSRYRTHSNMKRLACAAVLLLCCWFLIGCGGNTPMKPGGGGLPQPYDPGNGQYVPSK
jgi:hypothetical protein